MIYHPILINQSKQMNIEINNITVELKYTFRAFIIYEEITNDNFTPKGMKEMITMFYSVVMASYKDFTLTFDEFIEWLDLHPESLNEFAQWLGEHIKANKQFEKTAESTEQPKN